MDYFDFSSLTNATDFGDYVTGVYQIAGTGSTGRGLFAGGYSDPSGGSLDVIAYITISSTGNASDFGDMNEQRRGPGMSANETRATISGGYNGSTYASIDYVTIASTGNASDFGDLLGANKHLAGCSND